MRRAVVFAILFAATSATAQPYMANGVKIGEVTATSAIVWV